MSAETANAEQYAELCEQVCRADARRTPMWVRGGGTLLPDARDAASREVLDIRPLNRLIAHARADMTVTVQAGMTVAELQTLLGEHGQALRLDVPLPERATVGGLIAADPRGSRGFSRGNVRDLLLGITFVGRRGELLRAGGRVVKNVAGYDVCRLFTGSWGWLGAIVEATFRVSAIPESQCAVLVPLERAADADTACAKTLTGALRPASVDLLNEAARELGLPAAPLTLMLGFEGFREETAAQVELCEREFSGRCTTVDDKLRLATLRVAIAGTACTSPRARFTVAGSCAVELVLWLSGQFPSAPVVAHAPDGVVHVGLSESAAAELPAALRHVAELGGSWLLPRADELQSMIGPPREDWPLMRRVKAALDPDGVFGRDTPFDKALRNAK